MVIIAALVLAAFSILPMQSVKADASEASVVSYSWYTAPSNTVLASEPGDLIVVGEVENVGSNIISNVTVEGSAFSSSGTELATTTTQAFVYDMLPTHNAPFYLDLNAASSTTNDLSWVSSVNSVHVTVTSVTDTNVRQYTGLIIPAVGGSSSYIPNATYYVDGTIVNNGTQVAQDPWVVATFYNSTGAVIGLNFTDYLTSSIPPGTALQFFASPADDTAQLTSEITSYSLTVDSLTLSNGTSQLTPSPTASTSPGQFPTLPILVVVIVVIVVVIAALMLIRKRQKTPPPPPPPPPPPMP